jgi:hypothetical protein
MFVRIILPIIGGIIMNPNDKTIDTEATLNALAEERQRPEPVPANMEDYIRVVDGMFKDPNLLLFHEPESQMQFGAPHHFDVLVDLGNDTASLMSSISFQEGPIKEVGVNGLTNEILMMMVLARLRAFQKGPFSSRYNAMAITHLEESLMWLNRRTDDRIARGVEGKNEK